MLRVKLKQTVSGFFVSVQELLWILPLQSLPVLKSVCLLKTMPPPTAKIDEEATDWG